MSVGQQQNKWRQKQKHEMNKGGGVQKNRTLAKERPEIKGGSGAVQERERRDWVLNIMDN